MLQSLVATVEGDAMAVTIAATVIWQEIYVLITQLIGKLIVIIFVWGGPRNFTQEEGNKKFKAISNYEELRNSNTLF